MTTPTEPPPGNGPPTSNGGQRRRSAPIADRVVDMVDLDAATGQLRRRVDQRWVEVADRVLSNALLATRRSQPVRAHAPGGPVKVSEHVLVAYIRAAIADIRSAAPVAIVASVDRHQRCTGITIAITVQYDHAILPIADEIRRRTEDVLRTVLGEVIPAVTVREMHVHVDDVTTADPHSGREPDRAAT